MSPRKILVDRLREAMARVPRVTERRMFGGVTFMVSGKMCISAGTAARP